MLIRYKTGPDGKPVKKAVIYTQSEHGIDARGLDRDAVRIVEKLRQAGQDAYIVGGAVRDLLVGRQPKDYDIVTDAEPPRIKKLFYRSRIIGKRFRLVHVYAGPKIFEVSTFRSISNGTVGNTYGSIDEDALRRDFSMNALYYDPVAGHIVDYVGGVRDIRAKRLVPVIPLKTIFGEDPVRMIRAVKYAATTGFKIPLFTRLAIRRHAGELSGASLSRLGEEALKIFGSGKAWAILASLDSYGLLQTMLPSFSAALRSSDEGPKLKAALSELDAFIIAGEDRALRRLLAFVVRLPVVKAALGTYPDARAAYGAALQAAKDFIAPLTMPRIEIEAAVEELFVEPEIAAPIKKKRKRPRRKPQRVEGAARPEGEAADERDEAAPRPAVARPSPRRRAEAPSEAEAVGPPEDAASGEGRSRSAKRRRRRRSSGGEVGGQGVGGPIEGPDGRPRRPPLDRA